MSVQPFQTNSQGVEGKAPTLQSGREGEVKAEGIELVPRGNEGDCLPPSLRVMQGA